MLYSQVYMHKNLFTIEMFYFMDPPVVQIFKTVMQHNDEYSQKSEIKKGLKFNWASKQMILVIW